MKPYKGTCKECNQSKWISNARILCDECVYKKNHQGKTQFEVTREKQANKPIKYTTIKRKPLKSSKNTQEKRKEVLRKDRETYYQVFLSKPNRCEECGCELPDFFEDENGSIVMISQYSHILSKGSHNEFRNNIINVQRLCFEHHTQWETGDRKTMNIYKPNQLIIQKLRDNLK